MIYPVFCIRDIKTGFMSPTIDQNDLSAKRNFAYAINNSNQLMNYSPSDFQFYKIGNFDSQKGVLEPVSPIELICDGVDVYEK